MYDVKIGIIAGEDYWMRKALCAEYIHELEMFRVEAKDGNISWFPRENVSFFCVKELSDNKGFRVVEEDEE